MNHYINNPVQDMRKIRDLTVLEINLSQLLVVACDSDGGIGNKPHDVVKVTEEVIGSFAVRVPLFEILASGAKPFLVVDCLSIEMAGSGERIIEAIKSYASKAGLTEKIQFTGSTEENVPTMQTGVGVTVLGLADKNSFFPGSSQVNDLVVCAGIPKSGPEYQIRMDDPDILSIEDLMRLREHQAVRDILPVGSKGVLAEANQLAASAKYRFEPDNHIGIDINQSAGPATCAIFTISEGELDQITSLITAPIHCIGRLITLSLNEPNRG